jgi:hypothetical protein
MRTIATITTVAISLTFASASEARNGSFRDATGLDNCVRAAASESTGLSTNKRYYVDHSTEARQFYVNGTRWENGERKKVRIACTTSKSGHQVLAVSVASGRFKNVEPAPRIDVAQK